MHNGRARIRSNRIAVGSILASVFFFGSTCSFFFGVRNFVRRDGRLRLDRGAVGICVIASSPIRAAARIFSSRSKVILTRSTQVARWVIEDVHPVTFTVAPYEEQKETAWHMDRSYSPYRAAGSSVQYLISVSCALLCIGQFRFLTHVPIL